MFIRSFNKGELEKRAQCVCRFILPAGEIGHASAGVVDVEPGGISWSCKHTAWRQIFFILQGRGTITFDGKDKHRIRENMVVEIPYDAEHKVVASKSGPLRYLYVNDYGRPVLKNARQAKAEHRKVDKECEADLKRGEGLRVEPPIGPLSKGVRKTKTRARKTSRARSKRR